MPAPVTAHDLLARLLEPPDLQELTYLLLAACCQERLHDFSILLPHLTWDVVGGHRRAFGRHGTRLGDIDAACATLRRIGRSEWTGDLVRDWRCDVLPVARRLMAEGDPFYRRVGVLLMEHGPTGMKETLRDPSADDATACA